MGSLDWLRPTGEHGRVGPSPGIDIPVSGRNSVIMGGLYPEEVVMRITRFLPVVLLISSRFLAAAPPSCVQDSLANYIALGAQGCTLGGAVFANFSYSTSGSGGGVPAAQIKVAPTLGIPATPGFTFAAKWHAVAGQSQESVISYSAVSSSSVQTQVLHLDLGPAQIGGIIGSVTVQESTNLSRSGR